jgi:RNA polymerase sigma-54 factor
MLSLPSQAMYNYLVELSMANPMLEIPEAPDSTVYKDLSDSEMPDLGRDFSPVPDAGRDSAYYDTLPSEYSDSGDDYFDPYYSRGVAFESDALVGSLKLQLSMSGLSPVEQAIGLEIIGNLDDSGYFTGNLDSICLLYCQPPQVGKHVLSVIQGFQPRGIAASNVYEALCLQVEDSFPHAELARRIIRENLRAICDSRPEDCAKLYGVSVKCIQETFDYIRSLEPRPGNCDERPVQVNYILPDIIVKRNGDELLVYLSSDSDNLLSLSDYYLALLDEKDLSDNDKLYLRQQLNAARAIIHSVDIRRQTIHRAAVALVALQRDFFRFGPKYLRPLTMQQMAQEMGVNVSTVSRVVQDKYVSTPYGLFPMKYFFVRALKGQDDEALSAAAAKQRIIDLIAQEDHTSPLTDDELCSTLNEEGYCLSRRTVSKYRQAAGILSCVKRRTKRG